MVLFGSVVPMVQGVHDFSFALLIGVLIGTYSSIFIASPLLTFWKRRRA